MGQDAQSLPQQALGRQGGTHVGLPSDMIERSPSLALLEAEGSESAEDFHAKVDFLRAGRSTVARAVGVTKRPAACRVALDEQATLVDGSVMCATERDQLVLIMRASFRPRRAMVHIEKNPVCTSRNFALLASPPQD